MKFMQFSAQNACSREGFRKKQKLQDGLSSNWSHIFKGPFAAGQVFSASTLDTLLYQTFVKGYLISFVRLLLGIDAENDSGHLSSICVKEAMLDQFHDYGKLYEGLSSTTGEIPFAIYRTETATEQKNVYDESKTLKRGNELDIPRSADTYNKQKPRTPKPGHEESQSKLHSVISQPCFSLNSKQEHGDLDSLINSRLKSLEMLQSDFSFVRKHENATSYVIINPSATQCLKLGDIVYVIQPSYMCAWPGQGTFP